MSFAEHETVAVRILGVGGVDIHEVEIEGCHHIERREVATDMSGLGVVDNLEKAPAILFGLEFQIGYFHVDRFFNCKETK